jgi:effector-binding domain-containing protein
MSIGRGRAFHSGELTMTGYAPVASRAAIVDAPHRMVVYKHCTCTQSELKDTLGAAFAALYTRIAESGVATAGPPFVVYNESSRPGVSWDIDVCAPTVEAISPTADISYKGFPSERVVELFHVGPYETLAAAYEEIDHFVKENGLVRNGPPREIYLSEPEVPPEQIQTLIEQPIR